MHPSRRNFLKLSALGVAAATTKTLPVFAAPSGEIKVWITSANTKFSPSKPLAWKGGAASGTTITLHPETRLQEILGFGAAFTDAACYMFKQLSPDQRQALFHDLFHPSGMAFNMGRTCIGSSDYATKAYSFADAGPDPELKNFSIDHDKQYILPMLREARKVNPDLFLFSSPWSPPGWMKANNSMLGGAMQRKYMGAYANYFVKFLKGYEAEGVPVQAVTVQNEVDTEQDGRMPACAWPQEYEADFVRQNLGPTFESSGIKTQIWIIDHNYNLWGRALGELETPDVQKYAKAVGWHGYVGQVEWINRVRDKYPSVDMHWTEGGPDYKDPKYATDWCQWSATFTGILRNWCRSITAWNYALDEVGRPNIGPFSCGGLVTINSGSKAVSYSGQYHAFAHFSRLIKRGARRFDSQSQQSDVHHVGCVNPDGQHVLIVTNSGAAKQVTISLGSNTAELALESDSIATLAWT
jgi:glucosylceramidase